MRPSMLKCDGSRLTPSSGWPRQANLSVAPGVHWDNVNRNAATPGVAALAGGLNSGRAPTCTRRSGTDDPSVSSPTRSKFVSIPTQPADLVSG